MDVKTVGSYALLVLGAVTLVGALWQTLKRAPVKYVILTWVYRRRTTWIVLVSR